MSRLLESKLTATVELCFKRDSYSNRSLPVKFCNSPSRSQMLSLKTDELRKQQALASKREGKKNVERKPMRILW